MEQLKLKRALNCYVPKNNEWALVKCILLKKGKKCNRPGVAQRVPGS